MILMRTQNACSSGICKDNACSLEIFALGAYVKQQGSGEERQPLAVADFFVVQRVSLADLVQCFLPDAIRLLEIVVGGEGPVDVAKDHLLGRRLLKTHLLA